MKKFQEELQKNKNALIKASDRLTDDLIMSETTSKNDFEVEKRDLITHEDFHKNLRLSGDSYTTLSPLLRVHIRKLYVTGFSESSEIIALEVKRLDNRINIEEVIRYIDCHKVSQEWLEDRQTYLEARYNRELNNQLSLSTDIDATYDQVLEKARIACSIEVSTVLEKTLKDPDGGHIRLRRFEKTVGILRELYNMQRLARNLSTEKHEVVDTTSDKFKQQLEKLNDYLDGKVIDIKPLNPI